jgi:penicillin-binding protein 1C
LDRDVAQALQEMLRQPLPGELDRRILGAVDLREPVCWKTGTSTGNRDAWSFIYNSHYLVGVWVGNNNAKPARCLVGAQAALPLAARLFRELEPRSGPAHPIDEAEFKKIRVCTVSGLPVSDWCPHSVQTRVPKGLYLHRSCDVHWPARRLDDADGPGDGVIERWPGSAKGWDLAKIQAPAPRVRSADAPAGGTPAAAPPAEALSTLALRILNPAQAAEFVLTGEENGDIIQLRSSLDARSDLYWYLNDAFVGQSAPGRPLFLPLEQGKHKLVCMTPEGLTQNVVFSVLRPDSSRPFAGN